MHKKNARLIIGMLLIVITTVLFAILPKIYNNDFLLFNLMLYIALSEGLNLIYGFTGYLPFGYVGFFGTGAYSASILILLLHVGVIPAILLGGVTASAVGIILTPLLRLSGAYFAIANLAASQAIYYIISNPHLENITQGPYGIMLSSVYNATASYNAMLFVLFFSLVLVLFFRQSKFGLSLLSIKEDSITASVAGVNVVLARTIAWLLSAFVAGLCGGVFAWYTSVFYPETVFGLNISIFAIVFVLFGGASTLLGPLVGAIILYGMYNFIGISTPQYFQLIYGFLIIVFVLFLPDGVISLFKKVRKYVP
ncbi:Branched-chain amino acid transport system permease protein LivM [Desulfurella amilsii]|uniref:Branched-chain amino acid transport system permease protein LivM n=1 Tax=Desulfurella amilsii TaxID=1562698 RepID=A0A1X4XYU2_9BACT|nr:branched-chain amino acid ABC transporter permease [Desulfurella amilsii]OSS42684.1 Branched-chain amino acid transport system permease protein LivM [Desulfurella amilsii]